MVQLFRTAYPPTTYKAHICSCAFIFRAICWLITYVVPIIICVFYYFNQSQVQIDQEYPTYFPGDIVSVSLIKNTTSGSIESLSYPADIPKFLPMFEVAQEVDETGNITASTVRVRAEITDDSTIIGVNIIFAYNVSLRKWSRSDTSSYGFFAQQFPQGVEKITCQGVLSLYQEKAVDFRGSLPNDVIPSMNHINVQNLLTAQSNVSSLYFITWRDHVPQYRVASSGKYTFECYLKIMISDITIMHSLPLVSIIESIIILWLSTHILVSLIVGFIQHHTFYNGIVTTIKERHYTPTSNRSVRH
ncbi:hypothetical protein TVAG_212810 [Trichomonas vaginalis G3]|uniref:Transmembrane protein 231 n=1 Tax=Trichomonas vaginalis (strain ATCC PRA-98 / G3) TaxID=412133 RepID=A2E2S1_TRIV3|nr:carbohydrate sulfotransferase 5 family [Trichomonas vaginalis G3]EAY13099.1 hypothetical protein TVAG_212810 [Trichomonas vaginalis G3]KAI5548288.1 carbohydrate sulfotransferase 5 family [Trichomonas vaginalis G3]|eukprot:XP_001325322.1 hypothetical protein [Trichomonas vaginalis G3]